MEHSKTSARGWRVLRFIVLGVAGVATLVAGFYAEEDLRGRLAWSSYQREAARQGIELDPRAFVPAPAPDDQNFAMTPFLKPLFDMNPQPLKPGQSPWRDEAARNRTLESRTDFAGVLDLLGKEHDNPESPRLNLSGLARAWDEKFKTSGAPRPVPTRSAAAHAVLRDLEQYNPVLDELRAASLRPYARFNIDYENENPTSILLPHLGVLSWWPKIVEYRASAELAVGGNDAALDDLNLLFSISAATRNEPFMVSHLVRILILTEAQQIIWEGLAGHAWTEAQLRELQARCENLQLLKESLNSAQGEQAMHGTRFFDFVRANPKIVGEVFGNGSPMWDFLSGLRFAPRGWTYFEQVSYNRVYSGLLENVYDAETGQVHPQVIKAKGKQFEQSMKKSGFVLVLRHRLFSAETLPSMERFLQKSAAAQTTMDEAAVACALERYRMANGQLPGTLADLTPKYLAAVPNDVITGKPLKYHPSGGEQFVLYSVGWNETDEGGTMDADGLRPRDATQGDWCWVTYPLH